MKKKALILAGGSGKRFWPLSEKAVPKQLLSLLSPLTLIEETLQRLSGYLETKDIYIVTHRALAESFPRIPGREHLDRTGTEKHRPLPLLGDLPPGV